MAKKIVPVLNQILKAIEGIQRALEGKSLSDFEQDWLLNHGIQRGIEIISEASRHLPDELKKKRPEIRWSSIAGIGNVLRHEYYAISNDIIWRVVQSDLKPLKIAVEELMRYVKE